MLSAQTEFDRREKEIDEYISHLEGLEKQVGFSVTLINTMKSSTLLMIYNMVESTMTNLLQDVFDHMQAEDVEFDVLNDIMKELVLNYSKRKNSAKLVEKMGLSSVNLVVACFDRSDLFSGNIDCRKIVETLKELGIQTKHKYKEPAFLKIKTERNHLAHGHKSFSDCGKDYTAIDLRQYHTKVKSVLSKVAVDFENFLKTKSYA
jgi:hypothetical protein